MADDYKFCFRCGAELPEGSEFCPECGNPIHGDGHSSNYAQEKVNASLAKSDLGAIPVLMFVYGALAIIGAIMTIVGWLSLDSVTAMMEELYKSGAIPEEDYEMWMAIWDTVRSQVTLTVCAIIALILAASGILALVSGHYANKLINWKTTVILCAVASGLPLVLIPFDLATGMALPIVGFIVTYLIYQAKDKFTS